MISFSTTRNMNPYISNLLTCSDMDIYWVMFGEWYSLSYVSAHISDCTEWNPFLLCHFKQMMSTLCCYSFILIGPTYMCVCSHVFACLCKILSYLWHPVAKEKSGWSLHFGIYTVFFFLNECFNMSFLELAGNLLQIWQGTFFMQC